MELVDTLFDARNNWLKRNKTVVDFLRSDGLKDFLVRNGAPPGIMLVLAQGKGSPMMRAGAIPLVLKITTHVRGTSPWLRFRGGMLTVLRACINDPAKVPLFMATSNSSLLEVDSRTYVPKRYRDQTLENAGVFDSNQVASSYYHTTIRSNKLGFNPENIDKMSTHGFEHEYKEVITRFKIVLEYLLKTPAQEKASKGGQNAC